MLDQVNRPLKDLHRYHVLHKDVELRNWLCGKQYDRLMLVGFEWVKI